MYTVCNGCSYMLQRNKFLCYIVNFALWTLWLCVILQMVHHQMVLHKTPFKLLIFGWLQSTTLSWHWGPSSVWSAWYSTLCLETEGEQSALFNFNCVQKQKVSSQHCSTLYLETEGEQSALFNIVFRSRSNKANTYSITKKFRPHP